jgi:hypothetical protein
MEEKSDFGIIFSVLGCIKCKYITAQTLEKSAHKTKKEMGQFGFWPGTLLA